MTTIEEHAKPINSAKEQIRQTRIQKLAELADKGINPYPYVFEKNVQTVPAVNISVETLLTWKMCKDVDMLQKAILNSDYKLIVN